MVPSRGTIRARSARAGTVCTVEAKKSSGGCRARRRMDAKASAKLAPTPVRSAARERSRWFDR